MQNFDYNIPTKVYFGKGQIEMLGEIKNYASKVLMVYGGGSIKRAGIYDQAVSVLRENGVEFFELSGVDPNPRLETVELGKKLCIEKGLDGVLAIGGGSSIDCSKAIAAAVKYDGDVWDMTTDWSLMKDALPVFVVSTMAATGSEMDAYAVITKTETNEKKDLGGEPVIPKFSILDPKFTYSVPAYQTASGAADIISHVFEVYFNRTPEAYLQARMAEAIMKTVFHYGPIAVKEPKNYEARANLMWGSSLAINGLLSNGCYLDWGIHPIEHELSAYFDVTHGAGLAVVMPAWMEHVLREDSVDKFVEYAVNVWGVEAEGRDKYEVAREGIAKTKDHFVNELGLPGTLRELGIPEDSLEMMANNLDGALMGTFVPMTKEDVLAIYKACY